MVSCSHLIIVNKQRSNKLISDTIICQQKLVEPNVANFSCCEAQSFGSHYNVSSASVSFKVD